MNSKLYKGWNPLQGDSCPETEYGASPAATAISPWSLVNYMEFYRLFVLYLGITLWHQAMLSLLSDWRKSLQPLPMPSIALWHQVQRSRSQIIVLTESLTKPEQLNNLLCLFQAEGVLDPSLSLPPLFLATESPVFFLPAPLRTDRCFASEIYQMQRRLPSAFQCKLHCKEPDWASSPSSENWEEELLSRWTSVTLFWVWELHNLFIFLWKSSGC